jgi:PST family polysaccharide transporter
MLLNKLNKILNSSEKKRLFSNFLYLSLLQATNYLLPLITFPYLARVLGPEKFGLIAFAQAFMQYFVVLTDYGFNLSATREVSIYREDKDKLEEIFSAVMIIKLVLLLVSFILLITIVFSFEKFRKNWIVYILTFGIVIGQTLFPIWFFQGLEKMKYITFLNILAKFLFTIFIFLLVKESSDYWKVPLFLSLGFILSGIIALYIVLKNFKIHLKIVNFSILKYYLKEGGYIFISNIAISLYTISNTLILGLFTNSTIVGYYAAAEKIIKAIQGLYGPVSQTIYPYITKIVQDNKLRAIQILRKLVLLYAITSFLISTLVLIFSDLLINLIVGPDFKESIKVLRIISFLPFIISLSNILGIQTMLSFNYKKAFTKILIIASFINICLSILLIPTLQHIGAALSVTITESFITISMLIFLYFKGIRILEGKIV